MSKPQQHSSLIVLNGGLNEPEQPQKIKDNQWTVGTNVEAMADGVRRRKGSERENTIPLQKIHVQFENGIDTREFINGTSEYISQSFQHTAAMSCRRVSAKLRINSGTPTGNVTCAIYTDDGGGTSAPNAAFTGAGFTDFTSVDSATELTDEAAGLWFNFTLTTAVTLAANTKYWLVLFHDGATATGASTVDVIERTSSTGTAPNALASGLPVFWFDADDITGIADTNNTLGTVFPDKSLNTPGWAEFAGGTLGATMHTAGGVAPINGHAWVEQPATACKLALSGEGVVRDRLRFKDVFTLAVVYKPSSTTTNLGYMAGRKDGTTENGVSVPKKHASDGKYGFNIDSGTPVHGGSPQDTDTTNPLIMIIRRSGTTVANGYGTTSSGVAVDFGNISVGQTGTIELDALFRVDSNTVADAGFGLAYMVAYRASLTASEVDELYHWLSTRFGIAYDAGSTVGNVAYSTDGASWTDVPAADLVHRVYGGDAEVSGIYDFQKTDGTQRHIVAADGEYYKNVDGVMTHLSVKRSGIRNSPYTNRTYGGVNQFPSFAVGGNRLFATYNGYKISERLYIDADGNEVWASEGMQLPASSTTFATNTTDPLTITGTYYVDWYYWDENIGQPSNRRYSGVASTSNDVAVTGTTHGIAVSGLPGKANGDDSSTHIRLELREPGSSVFRLVKEIPIVQTTAAIGQADLPTTIEAEYNHNKPALHKIKLVADNRQFIANVPEGSDPIIAPARPYRMYYSAINGITPYYESFPTGNYRDFGLGDDDYITAMTFMQPQTLVVGMKNSMYAIDSRNPGTSDRYQISKTEGIAHHLAATVVKGTLYFLSDSAQSRGFYRWRQGLAEPERLRGADRSLALMEKSRFQYASCASQAVDADRNQWWTLLTSSGNTQHDTLFVYDITLQAWAVFEKATTRTLNVLGVVEESDADLVFGGGYDGIEYKQDIGDTDAGVGYAGSVKGKWLDFGSMVQDRSMGIDLVVEGKDEGDLTATLERDYGAATTHTVTKSMAPSGRDNIIKGNDLRGRGQVFRFGFSGSDPWYLKAIAVDVQMQGDE